MTGDDRRPDAVLLVGGLDTTGRAGLIRDSQAVREHFLEVALATTCTAVQTHSRVLCVEPTEPKLLETQIEAAAQTYRIRAVKVGLVVTEGQAKTIASTVARSGCPVVFDPVHDASNGDALVRDGIGPTRVLASVADVLTPNLDEAAALAANGQREQHALALHLHKSLGAKTILVTGGHAPAIDHGLRDVLVTADGAVHTFRGKAIDGAHTLRGKGCLLASHVAAGLARGADVAGAVEEGIGRTSRQLRLEARAYLTEAQARASRQEWLLGFNRILATLEPACVPEVGMNVAYAPPGDAPAAIGLAGRITIAGDGFAVVGLPAEGGPHHTGRIATTLRELTGQPRCVLNHRFQPTLVEAGIAAGLHPVEIQRCDEPPRADGTMEWASRTAHGRRGAALAMFWDAGMPGKEAMVRLVADSPTRLADLHERLHLPPSPPE